MQLLVRQTKGSVDQELLAQGQQMRLSACRVTPADLQALDALFTSDEFSRPRVAALRYQALSPPCFPSLARRVTLVGADVSCIPPAPEKPDCDWAKVVARNRAEFKDTVFRITDGDVVRLAKFVYDCQNPIYVSLASLQEGSWYAPKLDEILPPERAAPIQDRADHMFHLDAMQFYDAAGLGVVTSENIEVLSLCEHTGSGRVCSHGAWFTFDDVTDEFPLVRVANDTLAFARDSASPSVTSDMLAARPWLKGTLVATGRSSRSPSSKEAACGIGCGDHHRGGLFSP